VLCPSFLPPSKATDGWILYCSPNSIPNFLPPKTNTHMRSAFRSAFQKSPWRSPNRTLSSTLPQTDLTALLLHLRQPDLITVWITTKIDWLLLGNPSSSSALTLVVNGTVGLSMLHSRTWTIGDGRIRRSVVRGRVRRGIRITIAGLRAPLKVCPGSCCWHGFNAVDFDTVNALSAASTWFNEFLDGPVIRIRTDHVGDVGNLGYC